MTTGGDPVHDLSEAVRAVRAAVADAVYPLPLPSAASARQEQAALRAQIDDYMLPRLARLDAPLLAVVGGSTGAGRSTLFNSLVQAPVSATGVLRPTTRAPVLACHPADTAWFRSGAPLGTAPRVPPITAPALPAGMALLDVPDTDRTLAQQLHAAADLWLFVTTSARYGDAVPWGLLHAARERGTVVALVLDRVREPVPGAAAEVVHHLTELLTSNGLGGAPLFVVPETRVGGQGVLPDEVVAPLRTWLAGVASDARVRGGVARHTLVGALSALSARVETLAAAADEQVITAESLAEQVGLAYGAARGALERGLREAVLPASGRAARVGPASHGRRRSGPTQHPHLSRPEREQRAAWEANLVRLVCSVAADAAEQVHHAWRAHPVGKAMLAPSPPAGPPAGLSTKVERLARAWHGSSREELLDQVGELLDAEAARWLDGLGAVPVGGGPGERLRWSAARLERARVAADLDGAGEGPGGSTDRPAADWAAEGAASGGQSTEPEAVGR